MKTIVFSNGNFAPADWCKNLLKNADQIIVADGGARYALMMGLKVDHLIGDMDSIELEDFNTLKEQGCKISVFPEDKDKTDLELAVDLAVKLGSDEIHILASDGGRFDHQLGNALIGANIRYMEVPIWFYSGNQRATTVYPVEEKVFATVSGSLLSVIPLCEKVANFTIRGVDWPLNNVELRLGSTFTISNKSAGNEVKVSFTSGVVLFILEDVADVLK